MCKVMSVELKEWLNGISDEWDLCIIPCFNDLKIEKFNNMLYCVIDEKRGDGFKCYVREGNGFNLVGWLSISEYVDLKKK